MALALALELAHQPFERNTWRVPGAVFDAVQTTDGFLWFGTDSGLRRFDGAAFTEVSPRTLPALGDENGRKLLAARDGSLWIATGKAFLVRTTGQDAISQWKTGTAGLVRYADGTARRFTTADGLPSDRVWALAQDDKGVIWIGTEEGLARWDGARFTRVGESRPWILALLPAAGGDLWVATESGLMIARDGQFQQTIIRKPVMALAPSPGGGIWMARTRSLLRYRDGQTTEIPVQRPVFALKTDRQGNVWVGSEVGLFRIDDRTDTLVPMDPERWVLALLEDREGSLWTGSRLGAIAQLKAPEVRNLGAPEGLGGAMAFAALAAHDGSVWTSVIGGMARFAEGRFTTFRTGPDFSARTPLSLAEGRDGSIWIASLDDGLHRFRDGRFESYRQKTGHLPSDEVSSVLVDRAGSLWLAWENQPGISRFPGGVPGPGRLDLGPENGLCPGPQEVYGEGRGGRIWAGGKTGLSLVEEGRARCLTAADGLPGPVQTAREDDEGTLWLGCGDLGVVRFRDGKFAVIPPGAGLYDAFPFSFTDDHRGHLWITSGRGVFRVAKAQLHAYLAAGFGTIDSVVYNAENGMRTQECTGWHTPGPAVDGEGQLWVPTLAGLSVVRPPESARSPIADALIDRVLVDGRAASPGPVELPRGGGDLDIHFTAPSFLQPTALRFRYRLEGLDRGWVEAGSHRQARYAYLRPGDYRFQLSVFDFLGRPIGHATSVAVRVPPHIYQTTGFYAACALFLAGVVLTFHRLRLRRLDASHAAVHEERARIARDLHDTLGQVFASIGMHVDSLRLLLPDAPARVREMMEQTRQVVDVGHQQVRRPIWNIRSPRVAPRPLREVLEEVVGGFPGGIELTVAGAPTPLNPNLENELGHITREAVSNAVRHAKAKRIVVDANRDGEGLSLVVRDDGAGIDDQAETRGGIGLLGMRERAARVGGVLHIGRGESGGTEVSLFIPEDVLK